MGGGQGGEAYYGPPASATGYDGGRHDGHAKEGHDAGGHDRRPSHINGGPRQRLQAPSELPQLVSFAYFRDWIKDEDPRTFDDRAKLDEAYKKYRIDHMHKNNRNFWDEIKGHAWTREKYGIASVEEQERKRLRSKGREGKLDNFLQQLEGGDFDELSFDQKERAPKVAEVKPEIVAEPPTTAQEKPEENGAAGVAVLEDAADGKAKTEESVTEATGAPAAAISKTPKEEKAEEEQQAAADEEAKKAEEDNVMIPASPNTLFIKSLSPEISRADLQAHCQKVAGFDYVALADPNPLKRFHRVGWVVFKPDADMKEAIEKLCESKINDFVLHMDQLDKPSYQRLRAAPSLMNAPDRIKSSLEHVRSLVQQFETDNADDRGSKAIEAKLVQLRDKSDYDAPDGEDDHSRVVRLDILDRRFLDIYLHYLRTVFHTCYYCVCTTDFAEELTKKCIGHVRKQQPHTGKNAKQNEISWVKTFDEKVPLLTNKDGVDPAEYGGENLAHELSKLCKPNIQVEDEGKYRCKVCKKLFKAGPFVEKHILNKHADTVTEKLDDLKYFNNWVLDPAKVSPPVTEAPVHSASINYPANGGAFAGNATRMADTFGAFNQMFNPQYNSYMMGGYPPYYNPMGFPPMSAGFNGFAPGYGAPLTGDARALAGRMGDRGAPDMYGMGAVPMRSAPPPKRQRRESNFQPSQPPPPPKGAKIDPRAGKLHAYTDLDGPPAGDGDDMTLDY